MLSHSSSLLRALPILLAGLTPTAVAQEAVDETQPEPDGQAVRAPAESVTRHSIQIDGEEVRYTAHAGTIPLTDEDGTVRADVFHVDYLREVPDPTSRPVTFTFNGGPGSSSVWLHLGAFGPRRVVMDAEGLALPPPGRLADNGESLLDFTDLVFIDPVTTGFSRARPDEDPGQFHGVDEDVESVGEFIRLWLARNGRWGSPKFLCGESYGTTRAAGLSGWLQENSGIYLNGIVLISSILDFSTARFDPGNDLPYVLFLPTFSATAWYHGRLDEDLSRNLEETLAEVEEFALGEYATALLQGARLGQEERNQVAGRLARYTGLSTEYVLSTDLRIQISRFVKELRRDERLTVGRLDSRFTGRDRDAAGERYEFDPSYAAIQGPFTATLNDYLGRELGVGTDLTYEILTGRVRPWKYPEEGGYLNVAETLRSAMVVNPDLQVFVANGYYDLATPYFATRHTFEHLALDGDYLKRVEMQYYPSGHMMYIRAEDRVRLHRELAAFYGRVLED